MKKKVEVEVGGGSTFLGTHFEKVEVWSSLGAGLVQDINQITPPGKGFSSFYLSILFFDMGAGNLPLVSVNSYTENKFSIFYWWNLTVTAINLLMRLSQETDMRRIFSVHTSSELKTCKSNVFQYGFTQFQCLKFN